MLERAATDGHFGGRAATVIDLDVCGRRKIRRHIRLQVAPGNLNVADFAAARNETTARAVADMATGHIRLVEINLVEEDAHAAVIVDLAARHDDVAIAPHKMDGVAEMAEARARNRDLKRPFRFDPIGFGMLANDFESIDHRHPLATDHLSRHRRGLRRPAMRANETKRRAAARHDDACGAVSEERREAALSKVNHDRFGEPVDAAKMKRSAGVRGGLNGGGVVASARFEISGGRNCAERSSAPEDAKETGSVPRNEQQRQPVQHQFMEVTGVSDRTHSILIYPLSIMHVAFADQRFFQKMAADFRANGLRRRLTCGFL